MTQGDGPDAEALRRWRLVLGRYSASTLHEAQFGRGDLQLDQALAYLYDREYQGRGLAEGDGPRGASLDPSRLRALDWLSRTRALFPQEVYERVQAQAIERYGLTELLEDPEALRSVDATPELGKALLTVRGRLSAGMREAVREVIARVVDDITRRLRDDVVRALHGRRDRNRRSAVPSARNFDARRTVRENLRHYDPESGRLVIDRPYFHSRVKRQLPWDVVLCVDQSGSMVGSVLHSAVLAGIMSSLPGVRVSLVVFDTNVVDLSHLAADPVEVLLTVQLGGGTDIGKAVTYCEGLVRNPRRTVLVLLSDFMEGGAPSVLLQAVQRLASAQVTMLGLASLDDDAAPAYDTQMAQRLADRGMQVAALTPVHFARWLADVMGGRG